jgi:hypothetical protein
MAMKKTTVFTAFIFFIYSGLVAQTAGRPLDAAGSARARPTLQSPGIPGVISDHSTIDGYLVRLTTSTTGIRGYGFTILNANRSLVHRFTNPLPSVPKGIQNKDDAFKIAGWVIREFQAHGHWRNIVPRHVVSDLKIKTD